MSLKIEPGHVVSIAYQLTVDNNIMDDVRADRPLEYLHGYDNILPALEAQLINKQAGDELDLTLQPGEGYGEYDAELVDRIPIDSFESLEGIEVGTELELIDEDGDIIEATVVEITDEDVLIDLNPILAGKVLHYVIKVLDIREGTDEEREMGVPKSYLEEWLEEMETESE